MTDQVAIKGAEQLEELGKALKTADATVLRQELRRDLRAATKPLTWRMKESLGEGLPHSGGLAALMRKSSIGVRVRTEGRAVGVRIQAQNANHDLRAIDRGEIRHLVYGRKPWVRQSVRPHLVTRPFEEGRPIALLAVRRAMEKTANKITN